VGALGHLDGGAIALRHGEDPVDQDLPGVTYVAETGFYNSGFGSYGARGDLSTAGLADSGTRYIAVIDNIPDGVTVYGVFIVRWFPGPCVGYPINSLRPCQAFRILARVSDLSGSEAQPSSWAATPTTSISATPIDSPSPSSGIALPGLIGPDNTPLTASQLADLIAADPEAPAAEKRSAESLFGLVAAADVFVVLDDFQFQRHSFQQRNRMRLADGTEEQAEVRHPPQRGAREFVGQPYARSGRGFVRGGQFDAHLMEKTFSHG